MNLDKIGFGCPEKIGFGLKDPRSLYAVPDDRRPESGGEAMTEAGKQLELAVDVGRRDDGMARALAHADRVYDEWSALASEFLAAYASSADHNFMTQEVVAASEGHVPEPPDRRAWGGVVAGAVKRRVIVRKYFAVDQFGSPKPVWGRP
jgi:hypothetical protein